MAILFIHGFGGCGDLWRWQADHFSGTHRLIYPDLPGHGRCPWNGEDLEAMAALMTQEVISSGEKTVDVVASSFGGLVALTLWEKTPAVIRRLVFAGSLPRFTATENFPAGLDAARIRKLAGQLDGSAGPVLEMFFRSLFTMKERESEQYAAIRELRHGFPVPDRESLKTMLSLLETIDLRLSLSRCDKPVLFVLGECDPICPLPVTASLREMCPRAEIEMMKMTGHFPFLSRPDFFNRRVERFLA